MSNCHPEELWIGTIIHYLSSLFSIPIYGIAFSVLLCKCPKQFDNKYRNYLVAHIISGVLLEIHMGVFWRAKVSLPVPIMCSFGLSSDYSVENLFIFIYILLLTGASAVSILIHRMTAVILYADRNRFQNLPAYLRLIFFFFSILTIIFTFVIRSELYSQHGYKLKMQEKYGTFPDYFWCQNCFFMVFDSITYILFFIFGYITLTSSIMSAGCSAFVTYTILNSSTLRLSRKTAAGQMNVLYSLVAAFMVHLFFIFVPFMTYFTANFINIDFPRNSISPNLKTIEPYRSLIYNDHNAPGTWILLCIDIAFDWKTLQKCCQRASID
uniref:Serpentine Receptor, class T n=1 Tax=Caenorhabditis tropicalis TaxID=1561998 RepID=A0A1I7T6I9_9PELO